MLQLWVGRKVRLRALRPDDVEHFAKYADDSEVERLGDDIDYPYNPDRDRRDIEKLLEEDRAGDDMTLVIETLRGKFAGTVDLYGTDRRHRTAEIGIVLHNRKTWGKGYASEALRLLLRFAFRELGYEKINLSVFEGNTRAIRLYERLGFQHEARRRSQWYTDGRRWDQLMMGLTRAEYEARHDAWFPPADKAAQSTGDQEAGE